MIKSILIALIIAIAPGFVWSQTKLSKLYPVNKGEKIELKFDYPKLIHISTWDKKEISIEASVKINEGKNDAAFTLNEAHTDGKISISNKIDLDQISDVYTVVVNGVKTRFNSKEDFQNFNKKQTDYPNGISYNKQKDIEVTIEIKIPASTITEVTSVYGMVELENFNGPIKVDARYGGIDASLNEKKIGQIKLTNRYGKIYSNLDLKPTEQIEKNFYTSITAAPGTGPSYDINSSYGNIYVRKEHQ